MISRDNEEWRQIINFDNYEVSNFGNVRNKLTNQELSVKSKNYQIYCSIILRNRNNRTMKNMYVHRLVAFAFLDQPEFENMTVDHIDRNPSNNHVSNLRWATKLEQNINRNIPNTHVGKKIQAQNEYETLTFNSLTIITA